MSGWRKWAAVGLAAVLVCGAASQRSGAQDMTILPTMDPPPAVALAPASPATPGPLQPATPPIKPTAAATQASATPTVPIPATTQSAEAALNQLVAPIALYPDVLLGQVLMAATYPHEIAEAARWVRVPANRALSGDPLAATLKTKAWNPAVMALVPFPNLLAVMADKSDWTTQLGAAFVVHQRDVMNAVQRLRHAALTAGNLRATPECHCVIQIAGDLISILPSGAELVSVPAYNPAVAYGNWPDAASPPAAFPLPSGFTVTPGNVVGFHPPVEVASIGPIWGWESIDWPNRRIVVDDRRYAVLVPGHTAFAGGVWVHEAPLPHRLAKAAPVVTHPGHHTISPAMRRLLAMVRSPQPYPPPWWHPHRHDWALPPGTIVPPPPFPPHAWRDWRDGSFDGYR